MPRNDLTLARLLSAMGIPLLPATAFLAQEGCVFCKEPELIPYDNAWVVCVDPVDWVCSSAEDAGPAVEASGLHDCTLLSVDGEAGSAGDEPSYEYSGGGARRGADTAMGDDTGAPSAGTCCYPVTVECVERTCPCYGRPYLIDGAVRSAVARTGAVPWSEARATPDLSALNPAQRATLARWWTDAALAEHASVAGFHRFVLELMRHAAPSDLIARAQRAAVQELDHARRCFALASAYAGRPIEPGPFPVGDAAPVAGDLVALAVSTAREGAIAETVSARLAEAIRDRAADPAVRATMTVIARDEADHAALAWATLRWATVAGGAPVVAALALVFAEHQAPLDVDELEPVDAVLLDHGHVSPTATRQVEEEAFHRLIRPAAFALATASGPGE